MTPDQLQPEPTWEFVRRAERHHCALPRKANAAGGPFMVGDTIRCTGCRKDWILVAFDNGSQRDPIIPANLNWNLTSEHQGKE